MHKIIESYNHKYTFFLLHSMCCDDSVFNTFIEYFKNNKHYSYIFKYIKFIFPNSPIMDIDYPNNKLYNVSSWYNYYTYYNNISKIDKINKSYDLELENLNAVMQKNSAKTEDASPINDKCPVSNKPIDENRFSNFEGRMVGLCCDNCKSKFVKDPSSYRSKIDNFKPSKAFETSLTAVKSKEASKEEALEEAGEKLREISSKLNAMGPEINLGWSIAQSQK